MPSNFSFDFDQPRRFRLLSGVLIISMVVLLHLLPFLEKYFVPHLDYFNVMSVISYLRYPDIFQSSLLNRLHALPHFMTAPVFYYGLAYPLSFIASEKWVLLIIGSFISIICGIFAGGDWSDWNKLTIAVLMTFILMHVFLSPLNGHRRSFTGFFMLGILWLGPNPRYLGVLFLTALSAGIYPPASLVILTYVSCLYLLRLWRDNERLGPVILRLLGLVAVFFIVVSPYLINMVLTSDVQMSSLSIPIQYELQTWNGWIDSFLIGDELSDRGALFREPKQYLIFFCLLVLIAFESLCLGGSFKIKRRYLILLGVSLFLWILAHLFHPLIYQPVKYSRMGLLLVAALSALENLKATVQYLHTRFMKSPIARTIWYGLGVWTTVVLLILAMNPLEYEHLVRLAGIPETGWKIILGLPLFIVICVIRPSWSKKYWLRSLIAAFVLFSILVLPHKDGPRVIPSQEVEMAPPDLPVRYTKLGGLYEILRTTPRHSIVAGPPFLMNPVTVYGRRSAYTSQSKNSVRLGCKRTNRFWRTYFTDRSLILARFLRKNNIDLFLIDRHLLELKLPVGFDRCLGDTKFSGEPILLTKKVEGIWQGGGNEGDRFLLVSVSQLLSDLSDGNTLLGPLR